MYIKQKFNTLTYKEYFYYIDNRKKYKNFNELGFYRSILENEKLTIEQKIEIRDYMNQFFGKFFEFLQIKDKYTYVDLMTLGEELTKYQKAQLLEKCHEYMEKTLKRKRIKHRNFGIWSKSTYVREYITGPDGESEAVCYPSHMRREWKQSKLRNRNQKSHRRHKRRCIEEGLDEMS